jgi:hypothetical protein
VASPDGAEDVTDVADTSAADEQTNNEKTND